MITFFFTKRPIGLIGYNYPKDNESLRKLPRVHLVLNWEFLVSVIRSIRNLGSRYKRVTYEIFCLRLQREFSLRLLRESILRPLWKSVLSHFWESFLRPLWESILRPLREWRLRKRYNRRYIPKLDLGCNIC